MDIKQTALSLIGKSRPHTTGGAPAPEQSYEPKETIEISGTFKALEEAPRIERGNPLVQAFEGAKTILSGLASYAGVTTPVADEFAKNGVPERESTCPKVLAVLEQPLGQGMEVCPKEEAAYQALNQTMSGLFPTLERALTDPDAFKADLSKRFQEQKKLHPEAPYDFDFSDYAVPVMKQVGQAINKEVKELHRDIKQFEGKLFSKKKIEDRKVGLQYLNDLREEINDRVERNDFSYRRTQELGYFAACALGHFDMDDIHLRDRMLLPIDSYLQAEDKVDIHEEYRRYRANEFTIHQKPAHKISGFQRVDRQFEEAFFNPDDLEMVSLPTLEPLSEAPFMRLLNKDILLSGIAADPISADGFMRQGRLFWLHDVRHNSAIFSKKKQYEEERNLTPEQIHKLDRRIDVWHGELQHAMDQIEDRHLLNAVDTIVFNTHHDRGIPFVPSSYDENQLRPVTKSLRMMWGVSGQNQRFDNPRKNFKEGYAWVENFWKDRREQERRIVGC